MKRFASWGTFARAIFGAFASLMLAGALAEEPPSAPSGSIAKLDNFYRGMQLQGNLAIIGQGLVRPPSWLEGSDIDIRYQPKANSPDGKEVLFADSIIINRFIGGQWSEAVTPQMRSLVPFDAIYPWRSLDYFRTTPPGAPSGKWQYYGDATNGDLISARLQPYLDAGYKFSDITLMLSNVPWDAAARTASYTPFCLKPPGKLKITNYPHTGSMAAGDNEQCNPPAYPRLWKAIVSHLTQDLIAHFGTTGAGSLRFEMGDEWDSIQNVNMDARDYRSIYEGAYSAIRALLLDAAVFPGGFSGSGNEPLISRGSRGKVYDTPAFLVEEAKAGMSAECAPRSLNAIWGAGKPNGPPGGVTPDGDVSRAVASYQTIKDCLQKAGLPNVVAEIHQFGFIGFPPPVGFGRGSDQSSISANWTFQTLMGLKEQLNPRLVTHWDSTISVPSTAGIVLLNGVGFVDLILDHYQGASLYNLPITKTGSPASSTSQTKATAFWKEGKTSLVLSNFDLGGRATPTRIQVTMPGNLFATSRPHKFRYLRYSLSPVDNVFVAIKTDMGSAGLLSNAFEQCTLCYCSPQAMGTDYSATLALIGKNWPKYQGIMKSNLTWRSADNGSLDQNGVTHSLAQADGHLTVTLAPDEMLILESASKD